MRADYIERLPRSQESVNTIEFNAPCEGTVAPPLSIVVTISRWEYLNRVATEALCHPTSHCQAEVFCTERNRTTHFNIYRLNDLAICQVFINTVNIS